jgi:hypothetical protein
MLLGVSSSAAAASGAAAGLAHSAGLASASATAIGEATAAASATCSAWRSGEWASVASAAGAYAATSASTGGTAAGFAFATAFAGASAEAAAVAEAAAAASTASSASGASAAASAIAVFSGASAAAAAVAGAAAAAAVHAGASAVAAAGAGFAASAGVCAHAASVSAGAAAVSSAVAVAGAGAAAAAGASCAASAFGAAAVVSSAMSSAITSVVASGSTAGTDARVSCTGVAGALAIATASGTAENAGGPCWHMHDGRRICGCGFAAAASFAGSAIWRPHWVVRQCQVVTHGGLDATPAYSEAFAAMAARGGCAAVSSGTAVVAAYSHASAPYHAVGAGSAAAFAIMSDASAEVASAAANSVAGARCRVGGCQWWGASTATNTPAATSTSAVVSTCTTISCKFDTLNYTSVALDINNDLTAQFTPTPSPTPVCHYETCAEMKVCNKQMLCRYIGDPHIQMFSGKRASPMGVGPYIFAMNSEKNFMVQACHKRVSDEASVNSGLAIRYKQWTVKYLNNRWSGIHGSGISCSSDTCNFPTGERVSVAGGGSAVWLALPSTYCGDVSGLCGAFNPDANYHDAFKLANNGGILWEQGEQGVQHGKYQTEFAQSFAATGQDRLFTDAECPSAPYVAPPTTLHPYANCPDLEATARALCPIGDNFDSCIKDVGVTCDLGSWVVLNELRPPPGWDALPTPIATPSPPTPSPCTWKTCHEMHSCGDQGVMTCSSSGFSHTTMFSGHTGHPQGAGPYVLVQSDDGNFIVQTCHEPTNSYVSHSKALAVTYGQYSSTYDNGWSTPETGSGIVCGKETCTFPGGEKVSQVGGHVWISLPSLYCGSVSGLCGNYNPDHQFVDAYTLAEGGILDLSGQPLRWGGPFYGQYQADFAQSYAATVATSLFSASMCPVVPYTPPTTVPPPFTECPDLEAVATDLCPVGPEYKNCVIDVGLSCDLDTWIVDAEVTMPPAVGAPTPAPAPTPQPFPTPATAPYEMNCADMRAAATGTVMSCSAGGDPHTRMFSGRNSNPAGKGVFVLAQRKDTSFSVQVCQTAINAWASVYTGLAINSRFGLFVYTAGQGWTRPPNSDVSCAGSTCVFPTGERVTMAGTRVEIQFPAQYCGEVQGLCGNYNPDVSFSDTFTNSTGGIGQYSGIPHLGAFQADYVQSFKVPALESLFTTAQCNPEPGPYVEPPAHEPFQGCLGLKTSAEALCPKGDRYDDCIFDVSHSCDLTTWVQDARATEPPTGLTAAPTPSNPSVPSAPAWSTCAEMAEVPFAEMKCTSSGDPHVDMFSGKGPCSAFDVLVC